MARPVDSFPIDAWLADMKAATEKITRLGSEVLDVHRGASEKAETAAEGWHLSERHHDSTQALWRLVDTVRKITESIDSCRHSIHDDAAPQSAIDQAINGCAEIIETQLPVIEDSLVAARHAALDLLQWTQREGKLEGSTLPAEYRASFAELIAYTPIFKPMMEAFQEELLRLNQQSELRPDAQRLISLVSRYNAVLDSARSFIRSVVEPPLELVFNETKAFLEDLKPISKERVAMLATEINDCCQLLLYDPAAFERRVEHVRPQLADWVDASMVVLTVNDEFKVILTVDEDPLFEQLAVTLLRVIELHQLDGAADDLTKSLYGHFTSE